MSEIVHAVAKGEVDVAAVWGPVAGYFARKEKPPLVVTAIEGNAEARLPMTFDISMGVRRTDKELKAQVDSALSSLAPQIKEILVSYGVPVLWVRYRRRTFLLFRFGTVSSEATFLPSNPA